MTLGKLPLEAHGPYVYTLLSGKALEAVEHLETKDYHVKGCEKVLWKILDTRIPQKETTVELGEILSSIFALQGNPGETLKQ